MSRLGGEWPLAWISLEEAGQRSVTLSFLPDSRSSDHRGRYRRIRCGLATLSLAAPVESALATLINEIAAVPEEFALILDDYHVIEAQPIHDAIAFPLEHMLPQMHLVIASRTDPPLPLANCAPKAR